MKQCFITYDKTANTFDIFSGAKGKGSPLKSIHLITDNPKNQSIKGLVESLIKEGEQQGYKVNLDNEIAGLLGNHIATKIKEK